VLFIICLAFPVYCFVLLPLSFFVIFAFSGFLSVHSSVLQRKEERVQRKEYNSTSLWANDAAMINVDVAAQQFPILLRSRDQITVPSSYFLEMSLILQLSADKYFKIGDNFFFPPKIRLGLRYGIHNLGTLEATFTADVV
jgi:hypothetical protein